jgi:hypothetical protein
VSFSLSSFGDEVYLFSADAGAQLTGYSHGFEFGAAADGESFGRYVISTGEEQFPAQIARTPGQANSGPRVGPIVINEIMYNPEPGGDGQELRNITQTRGVVRRGKLTNTWRLNGADSFLTNFSRFERTVLLVAINPRHPREIQRPRERHDSGPASERCRQGERGVAAARRLAPTVPLHADEVRTTIGCSPVAADGGGPSLQRGSAAYGNDPINWAAATPVPARNLRAGRTDDSGAATKPDHRRAQYCDYSVNADGTPR